MWCCCAATFEGLLLAFAAGDDTLARVRRGLWLVLAPNAAAMVLGAVGLLRPTAAAVVNNGSTVVAGLAALAPLLQRVTAPRVLLPRPRGPVEER